MITDDVKLSIYNQQVTITLNPPWTVNEVEINNACFLWFETNWVFNHSCSNAHVILAFIDMVHLSQNVCMCFFVQKGSFWLCSLTYIPVWNSGVLIFFLYIVWWTLKYSFFMCKHVSIFVFSRLFVYLLEINVPHFLNCFFCPIRLRLAAFPWNTNKIYFHVRLGSRSLFGIFPNCFLAESKISPK